MMLLESLVVGDDDDVGVVGFCWYISRVHRRRVSVHTPKFFAITVFGKCGTVAAYTTASVLDVFV